MGSLLLLQILQRSPSTSGPPRGGNRAGEWRHLRHGGGLRREPLAGSDELSTENEAISPRTGGGLRPLAVAPGAFYVELIGTSRCAIGTKPMGDRDVRCGYRDLPMGDRVARAGATRGTDAGSGGCWRLIDRSRRVAGTQPTTHWYVSLGDRYLSSGDRDPPNRRSPGP